MQATFLAKDGSSIPVEGSAMSRFVAGEVVATHGFFRDITERLRAQVLEAHGIAGAWNLAPGLVRAGVSTEALERLAGDVPAAAHPAAIRWIAASMDVRAQSDVVAQSTRRISELVGAVKAYSFMDRAAEQVVDVHEGIETTLVILAHRLKNVSVRRDYDRSLPGVRALGSGLNQVWTNIIDKAIDATDGNGTIAIRTRGQDGQAVVETLDDGSGIPADHLGRIFEPFFTTKPQGQGTGLGLDTAWRIVTEEHGGRIEVESALGRTIFRVIVPFATQRLPASE